MVRRGVNNKIASDSGDSLLKQLQREDVDLSN